MITIIADDQQNHQAAQQGRQLRPAACPVLHQGPRHGRRGSHAREERGRHSTRAVREHLLVGVHPVAVLGGERLGESSSVCVCMSVCVYVCQKKKTWLGRQEEVSERMSVVT